MTTTAANVAGHDVAKHSEHKEKVEKRRALGRGLESLLPGPRAVTPQQQVPHQRVAPVPNDIESGEAASEENAELRSAGRTNASAPTQADSHFSQNQREVGHPTSDVTDAGTSGVMQNLAPADSRVSHTARDMGHPTENSETITIYAQAESRVPGNLVVNLAIENIDKNPFQTRYVEDDDALEELSDSIREHGVVQPIMVRPADEDGRYVLILGERRLHASVKAGKTQIPALVRRVSEQQAAEMTIIENLQREDLSPLEQAQAFKVLSQQFSLTQDEIGKRVGLSRASIANYMRLLKLPRDVMQLLAEKKLNFNEAKELLKLNDNDRISEAALYAVKKGLTIEQIERLVLSMEGFLDSFPGMPGQEKKKSGARWVDPNVKAAQTDLERLLGVRVRIRDRKGKGKIVIEYATVDDYERVVEVLRGKK